jgi:putative membrane protein
MSRIFIACLAGLAAGFQHAALAQTAIPPAPKDFAAAVAQSDRFEIVAAQDALTETQSAKVRSFAERMVADHQKLAADLARAASEAGVVLPPGMSPDQAQMLRSLQSQRGADFDRAYARQQVLAHSQAVAITGDFARAGADPALRKAAQSALPIIEGHLKMADDLAAGLGGG